MGFNVQGYGIVNDAYAETIGEKLSGSLDTKDIVTMGKDLDSNDLLDAFYGALTNKIVKTIGYVMSHKANSRKILTDAISYGAFVEKFYVDDLDAVETPSAKVSQSNGTMSNIADPFGVTTCHTITAKVFGTSVNWSYEFNIELYKLREAFRSESDMMALVDSIFVKANADMELEKEALISAAANTLCLVASRGNCVKNLLQRYNDKSTTKLTKADAIKSADFYKVSNKDINHTVRLMGKPSKKYNPAKYLNKLVNPTIEVLSEYAESSKVFLESGTYHADKVALGGNYSEVDFWQFNAEDFDNASRVSISNVNVWNDGNSTPSAIAYTTNGIVAVVRDDESVKALFDLDYQWSMPNPRARITSYGYDFKRGYTIEPHANVMVFGLWDIDNTTNMADANTHCEIVGDVAPGNTIELKPSTTTSNKTVSKVYYSIDGGTNWVEVTKNSDNKYICVVPSFDTSFDVKVTISA